MTEVKHKTTATNATIGFIGGGHMATAIIEGLSQTYPKELFRVADLLPKNRDYFNQTLGIKAYPHFSVFIEEVDCLVLAIKPQGFSQLLPELLPHLKKEQMIISIAAGVATETLNKALKTVSPTIVRVMPNLPASIGLGVSALFTPQPLEAKERELVETIFTSCGFTTWVESEELISAVIAVAGSSPAYFFYLLEIMIEEGTKMGLSPESSALLAKQTMLGSAQMALNSSQPPKALKESVMSPEGTTEQAIFSFEHYDLAHTITQGMRAAAKRDKAITQATAREITQEIAQKITSAIKK